MPNGLSSLIHKNNPPNFQGCWGKIKKWSEKKFVKKFWRATEQIGKRLLPGSGETDYRLVFSTLLSQWTVSVYMHLVLMYNSVSRSLGPVIILYIKASTCPGWLRDSEIEHTESADGYISVKNVPLWTSLSPPAANTKHRLNVGPASWTVG